jgi:hypothetical protein
MVVLVVVAVAVGVTAGFVHRTRVELLGLSVPIGMAAALGGVLGVVLLTRRWARSRLAVAVVGAAVAVPVLVLSQFRGEGDLVVVEDGWGLTLLGGTALVLTAGLVVPISAYHGGAAQPHRDPVPDSRAVP